MFLPPRPSIIAPTKWGSPRVRPDAINELNLVSAVACNEMNGDIVRDLLTGIPLIKNGGAANGGATWGASSSAGIVGALTNNGSFPTCAYAYNTPAVLRCPWPVSMFWRGVFLGTPTTFARFAGVMANNTETSPYMSWGVYWDGTSFQFGFNSNGTFTNFTFGRTVTTGVPTDFGFTMYFRPNGGNRVVELYYNGAQVNSTNTVDTNQPTYDASSVYCLGNMTATSYNPACIHDVMYVGRQRWLPEHFASLHNDPHQIFEQPGELEYFTSPQLASGGGGPPPSFLPAWAARANPIYGAGLIR